MQWVIQKNIFWENEDKLTSILGDRLIWVEYTIDGPIFSNSPDTRYIFYGSHTLGRRLQKQGAICWLYEKVYDCSYYLSKFGNLALNRSHIFIDYGSLPLLMETIGTSFFIKQDSGYKDFTGEVYNTSPVNLFPEDLLLLAPIQEIGPEWRAVISDGKLLTFSQYGSINSNENPTDFIKSVLDEVKDRYDPAPMWTLDVCTCAEEFKVVEVNSLFSAGWYDCDIELIINTAEKIIDG